MDHYLEIRLLPDPEFTPTVLMNALFAKLHRGLVERNSQAIGISFPDVTDDPPALGARLRLHATADNLKQLMSTHWLTGMGDHISLIGPEAIPAVTSYRTVRRVQAKSNPERLRRRLMKHKGITEAQARDAIPDSVGKHLRLPFVSIKSRSTDQEFRLFIRHGPISETPTDGEFSRYGLSPAATVPWF